ncbi:MAG TPA: paraquat-inducible protein A [Acetobacteraceae bacterium]|nr:paraquat-inducible protein A [Acetobacteraceae bacterium]
MTAPPVLTPARLCECHDCTQLQVVPPLPPGVRAVCLRCDAVLRHTHRDPLGLPLALNIAAIILFFIATSTTLMVVSRVGQSRIADLFSGPLGLEESGMWELTAVILFTTFAAPLAKLLATTTVLLGAHLEAPPPWLRGWFFWANRMRPWSMIEVYLLGVFVALVRLGKDVNIELGPALYALAALMVAMIAADYCLDREAVWEAIGRRRPLALEEHAAARHPEARRMGCAVCHFVTRTVPGMRCPRCGFPLHARKPNAVARTWAFGTAALILYIPANTYPVLTLTTLGASTPSTILGGVRELLDAGMWPLAALVFFASIVVPAIKVIGLAFLLISTQSGSSWRLRDRTWLYRIIDSIGRWSMIDIFVGSLLVAVLQFGELASVLPGPGAIAFASVVILTMLAAQAFDPRLMWDAADIPSGKPAP